MILKRLKWIKINTLDIFKCFTEMVTPGGRYLSMKQAKCACRQLKPQGC